jgi:nucleotide-binding universal stress UspA family protein
MFQKVLVPLDGSKNAEASLPWVKRYAGPSKGEVLLLQVLTTEYPLKGPSFLAGTPEAKQYLQGIEREFNFSGIPAKIVLRNGAVSRTIIDVAMKEGCQLIVMTTRGASRVTRWLMGGVTEQVMRLSPIPVLIIRSQTTHRQGSHPERILVPLDGSTRASSILPWAERLARFHHARVVLLHVRPKEKPSHGNGLAFPSAVRERISRESFRLQEDGIKTVQRLEEGDAAEEILKACRASDLLALTTHGYGGFKRWVFGSVAEKVIREAPVPVFIYKGPAR